MGLFKEIYCAECGKKTSMLFRTHLCDGNYLCDDCTACVPSYMKESFRKLYELEGYRAFKEYIKISNEQLRPNFNETHSFYNLHLDASNCLFCMDSYITEKTLFFDMGLITKFGLDYRPEEVKNGLLGEKVKGKIYMELEMEAPYFYTGEVLADGVKARASSSFFGNKVKYENPDGMDDFLYYFNRAWQTALESEADDEEGGSASELQKAMALFMIDDLAEVTPEELRDMRNRLIKTFHPDEDGGTSVKQAQKINDAYEIIKSAIE